MDTFEKTLRLLSQRGYLAGYRSLSDQVEDSLALGRVLSAADFASVTLAENYRSQIDRLTAGYGLSTIAQDLAEQELSIRLALSNTYANLTGIDALAESQLGTIDALQEQIEELASPVKHLHSLLSKVETSSDVVQAIQQLDVTGGLVGEFPYSGYKDEGEAAEQDSESEEREEVESRIIQVGYIPQKVFDAIRNEPKLMRGLEPREFEKFTAELLSKLGFRGIQLTPSSGDGGRDIIATQVVNDIPVIMAFECKKYGESNKIGPEFLRALLGAITHGSSRASMGVLVTTSSFTAGARSYIAAEASIDGKDFEGLVKWLSRIRDSGKIG